MKLSKNKKGMILIIFLAVAVIGIILPSLFMRVLLTKKAVFTSPLGKSQVEIMQAVQSAENQLFYSDQAAIPAVYQSIHELAGNGGFSPESASACGAHSGYSIWTKQGQECYPDNYKENLAPFIKKNLPSYLSGNQNIPSDYNITVTVTNPGSRLQVTGITGSDMLLPISNYGKYSINPSFRKEINYDIRDFGRIIAKSKSLINSCSSEETAAINQCVAGKVQEFNKEQQKQQLKWSFARGAGRVFKFDIESKDLAYYDSVSGFVQLKPVTIRFALEI